MRYDNLEAVKKLIVSTGTPASAALFLVELEQMLPTYQPVTMQDRSYRNYAMQMLDAAYHPSDRASEDMRRFLKEALSEKAVNDSMVYAGWQTPQQASEAPQTPVEEFDLSTLAATAEKVAEDQPFALVAVHEIMWMERHLCCTLETRFFPMLPNFAVQQIKKLFDESAEMREDVDWDMNVSVSQMVARFKGLLYSIRTALRSARQTPVKG